MVLVELGLKLRKMKLASVKIWVEAEQVDVKLKLKKMKLGWC